jgi:succinoglycan biosynthesis transport protein ExoP
MKLIELSRLILKHLVLLILVPVLLAGIVFKLTGKSKLSYSSSTVLYTGLATGSSIEMDKSFNYFATNTAFDNLINIVKSRETQEEVAIRLLSQHLLLPKADPKYISSKFYAELNKKIPAYIYNYVVRDVSMIPVDTSLVANDSLAAKEVNVPASSPLFPASINRLAYEKTVENLTRLMKSSDTNFVYKLLNFQDEHYSIKAISTVKAERVSNSDLIKLSYEVDDPGICQQTLSIFNEVCIKNYKHIKENRSDDVVKYFEGQLSEANAKLRVAEDKLLGFNKANNIINYYEQSKAVAIVKEDMSVDYANKKAQLAGTVAAAKKLEDKLNIQQQIQVKSNTVIDKRKELGDVNYELAMAQAESGNEEASAAKIDALKKRSESLKSDIKKSVGDLYTYQNTTEGLPVAKALGGWIDNVVEADNLKAKLKVMDGNNREFQQQYAAYAPAGATIKRIEREISVSEQGYLEILHGLNLAKLKLQDNELTSNLKAVDPPYYPIESKPRKRGVLVIAASLLGFILVLGIILAMEYTDDTLKNYKKAGKALQLPAAGMLPKIFLNPGRVNLPFVQNRLVEIAAQNMEQFITTHDKGNPVKTILFLSTQEKEGKSVAAGNLAAKLVQEGKKVLLLNYSGPQQPSTRQRKFPLLNRMLGYTDPRIDFSNPFLASPSTYLPTSYYFTYSLNEQFYKTTSYTDILDQNNISISFVPDYVFIELPALLYNNHPAGLLSQADMSVLICRSNRLWSEADQASLNTVLPIVGKSIAFIINGVELKETESLLGDLPKKSSSLRKKVKNIFRFQFFTKNQI